MGAEECHVSGLGEHHEIRCLRAACAHERIPNMALNTSSVRSFECLFALRVNAQFLEHSARNPRKLAAGIDQRFRERTARATQLPILDLDRRPKDAHVRHYAPHGHRSRYQSTAPRPFATRDRLCRREGSISEGSGWVVTLVHLL